MIHGGFHYPKILSYSNFAVKVIYLRLRKVTQYFESTIITYFSFNMNNESYYKFNKYDYYNVTGGNIPLLYNKRIFTFFFFFNFSFFSGSWLFSPIVFYFLSLFLAKVVVSNPLVGKPQHARTIFFVAHWYVWLGGFQGRWKEKKRKWERKHFLWAFGWREKRGKYWWGPGVFSRAHQNVFYWVGILNLLTDKNAHVHLHISFIQLSLSLFCTFLGTLCLLFFFFLFFFLLFFFCFPRCCHFFFSFDFLCFDFYFIIF